MVPSRRLSRSWHCQNRALLYFVVYLLHGGFLKWWYPYNLYTSSILIYRFFHFKPWILGYTYGTPHIVKPIRNHPFGDGLCHWSLCKTEGVHGEEPWWHGCLHGADLRLLHVAPFESRNSMWGLWLKPACFTQGWKSWQGLLPGASTIFLQFSDVPICRAPLFPTGSPRWSLTFSSLRHADCIFPGGRWDIERPEMAHRMLSILNCTNYRFMLKWWFPKIGVPPNHPFKSMLSPFNPSSRIFNYEL